MLGTPNRCCLDGLRLINQRGAEAQVLIGLGFFLLIRTVNKETNFCTVGLKQLK
jgi:hypothetical protein